MNSETMLFRQINPSFIQNGRVSSAAFRPTPKDEKQLSVYDGDRITPKESYEHFTEALHCHSIGVLAITVNDCANNSLPVLEDSATFWSHALIDFSQKSNSETRKIAEHLRDIALTRGWVYGPFPS